jgi:hypothetical protein
VQTKRAEFASEEERRDHLLGVVIKRVFGWSTEVHAPVGEKVETGDRERKWKNYASRLAKRLKRQTDMRARVFPVNYREGNVGAPQRSQVIAKAEDRMRTYVLEELWPRQVNR